MRTLLLLVLLLSTTIGCDGPGPLTPTEVRFRWQHGELLEAHAVGDEVEVVVQCPEPHQGAVARFRIATREVRELERRWPLRLQDPLNRFAWRRCEDAFAVLHPKP